MSIILLLRLGYFIGKIFRPLVFVFSTAISIIANFNLVLIMAV
jgi:hypothetical protein